MSEESISITRPSTIVGGPQIARQPSMSQPATPSGVPVKPQNNFPTETIDLPSEGHFYPEGHPLSAGRLELKMMTAREEDILTNQNLIKKGIVLDKLLESLIVTPVKIDDILVGDKNAAFFAARRLAYGDTYGPVKVTCPKCQTECERKIDLSAMKSKDVDVTKYPRGQNEFEFSSEVTTRLRAMIVAIDGNTERGVINKFVNQEMPSRDSLAFRAHVKENTPDLDMTFDFSCDECSHEERMSVPLTAQFFWPES